METDSSQNIDARTKEGIIWNTGLPVVFQLFRFAISILIARILNPRDFGIIGIASMVIFYANSLSNFGFSTALIQRREIDKNHINSVFTINLTISVILAALSWVLSQSIAAFFTIPELKNVFRALSSIFLITAFYTTPLTLLRRSVKFKIVSQIDFVRGLTQSLLVLFFAYIGFEYWALVIGLISANLLAAIIANLKAKWMPRVIYDTNSLRDIINFSMWNFIGAQLRLLNDYVDKYIIGKILGPTSLGFYEKGYAIAMMPIESVANRVSGVMFSAFSRQQHDVEKLKQYLVKSITTTALLCFPMYAGLIVCAPHFVTALLGDKWVPMIPSFRILLSALMIGSLTNIISALNIGTGQYKRQILSRAACLVLLVAIALSLVNRGIAGVAWAVLIYQVSFFFTSYQITKKYQGYAWRIIFKSIAPGLCATAIMWVLLYYLTLSAFAETTILNLFFLVVIGFVIYTTFLVLINFDQTKFIRFEIEKLFMRKSHKHANR